jgi:hypothetical protein
LDYRAWVTIQGFPRNEVLDLTQNSSTRRFHAIGPPTSYSYISLPISFCLMPELSTQQVSSNYWPSLRCVAPVAFAYFSDLNRP